MNQTIEVANVRIGSKAPVWPSTGDFGSASNIGNVPALRKLSRRAIRTHASQHHVAQRRPKGHTRSRRL